MWRRQIYLDAGAATPLDRRVARAMSRARRWFANPASLHAAGVAAGRALTDARRRVAKQLSASPDEIVFVPSATAANNLALIGLWSGVGALDNVEIISSPIEHRSVLGPLRELERRGAKLVWLQPESSWRITPKNLRAALRPATRLVSLAYANSETGVVEDLSALARVLREWRRAQGTPYPYFHSDTAPAARFLPLNPRALGLDLLSLSGRKIYGPAQGALWVRRGLALSPLVTGGGQEAGLWAGTEDVPAALGLAAALEVVERERDKEVARLRALRGCFLSGLSKIFPDAVFNGSLEHGLPHCLNISFPGAEAEAIVLGLDAVGVAVSTGSACLLREREGSYVIEALRGAAAARSAVRFTLDRHTTKRQLDYVLRVLPEIIHRARFD